MVTIRKGKMRDCNDLLTVYQTTRWYYRVKDGGYRTVEEIKQDHRGIGFKNWGWLVAEEDDTVIGEVVFALEKNPVIGRIGIIRNLDIDVRHQKKTIGTQLTRAAEAILKERKASRVVALTPPEAYNYWMKVDYFARGSLLSISTSASRIKTLTGKGIKATQLKSLKKLPSSMSYSHLLVPGYFTELAGLIIDHGMPGRLLEFTKNTKHVGIGVIVKIDSDNAYFAVDVLPSFVDDFGFIQSKLLSLHTSLKVKKIYSMIPKDQLERFKISARWSVEETRDIPITRLI